MLINVWSDGDSSVGISGCTATVDIDCMEIWADNPTTMKEIRERARQTLTEAFRDIFDDARVHVMFEDELRPES